MRRRSGFTLIEILAVVAIFALLAALVMPNLGSLSSRTLRQRADAIAARLELARQRSVLTGIPHRLLIDLDEGAYRLEWWITEIEASGEQDSGDAESLDLRGQSLIPMSPPLAQVRAYRPLPGLMGRFERLEDSVVFLGIETPEGWIDQGRAFVSFARDGTASYTALYLDDDTGRSVVLDVLPLADIVRVSDAAS